MNNSSTFFHKIRSICRTMRKGKWKLTGTFEELIRSGDHCPITFVVEKEFGISKLPTEVNKVSSMLMLSKEEAYSIINAADYKQGSQKQLRKILLKAANLK